MEIKRLNDIRARDIMTRDVVSVAETTTVMELVALLRDRGISGAPVLNAEGKPSGVASLTDIAGAASDRAAVAPERSSPEFYVHGWEDRLNPDELRQLHVEGEGLLVRDIMTPAVFSVPADMPLPEVAKAMVTGRLHRLLVTESGELVGIVTTLDALEAIAAGN